MKAKIRLQNLGILGAVLLSFAAMPAVAQDTDTVDTMSEDKVFAEAEEVAEGDAPLKPWAFKLKLGASASFTHTSNVVGTADGIVLTGNVLFDSGATYKKGQHTWENSLSINAGVTYNSAVLQAFVKSQDQLALASTYLFSLKKVSWLGPYAQFNLDTQLAHGPGLYGENVDLRRVDINENEMTENARQNIQAGSPIALTRPFEPLTLKESVGLFANPLEKKEFTLKAKAGIGAQQFLTQGGYAVLSDEAGAGVDGRRLITAKQLRNAYSIGGDLALRANGQISKPVNWEVYAAFFFPFSQQQDGSAAEFNALEQIQTDLGAKLSVKIAKWVSLDYVFSAKYLPLARTEWQIINGIVLSAGFDIL